jgi:hypothetical protein
MNYRGYRRKERELNTPDVEYFFTPAAMTLLGNKAVRAGLVGAVMRLTRH